MAQATVIHTKRAEATASAYVLAAELADIAAREEIDIPGRIAALQDAVAWLDCASRSANRLGDSPMWAALYRAARAGDVDLARGYARDLTSYTPKEGTR